MNFIIIIIIIVKRFSKQGQVITTMAHTSEDLFSPLLSFCPEQTYTPSVFPLLRATAVESPLMTSRKKSAGLLWGSQVYPRKQF